MTYYKLILLGVYLVLIYFNKFMNFYSNDITANWGDVLTSSRGWYHIVNCHDK